MIHALGFAGRANHYAGALWHYELVAQGYSYASGTVQFVTPTAENLITTVSIGLYGSATSPTDIQHLNLSGETATSIAKAFELLLNSGYTAVRAQASGSVLTIYSRAVGAVGNDVTISAQMGGVALTTSGSRLAATTAIGAPISRPFPG
jgi:phage tail sheath gpL-like